MRQIRADLHIHTVLSPCAEVEMIPPLIVEKALENHLGIIAITDHNASANVAAVQMAAEGTGLTVLPGMEVQTREDVHLLTLFETLEALEAWQTYVNQSLPNVLNNTSLFGEQFVVDENGEFLCRETRLLLTSTQLSIDEIVERVPQLGGIVIPAHVERTSYGLFPSLGLISEKWHLPALEISRQTTPERAASIFPAMQGYPLIQNGDAHRLDEILGSTLFTLASPTLSEIRMALGHLEGRAVCIEVQPQS